MIFLLPSLEELASAGRGLEAFVGRQTPGCQAENWPAASFLPGEAAQWGMGQCDVRRLHPFPGLWGLGWVIAAPFCPWVGWWFPALLGGGRASRLLVVVRLGPEWAPEGSSGGLLTLVQHSRKPH